MYAIFKREFLSYFRSPVGYVAIAIFSFLSGFIFYTQFSSGMVNIGSEVITLRSFFVIIVPIITMGLLAEDKKRGTDILYYTTPVSLFNVVVGKTLASFALYAIMFINVIIHIIVTLCCGGVFGVGAIGTIVVFFFMAFMYISIGLFASAITDNQIVSAIVSFIIILITQLIIIIADYVGTAVYSLLSMIGIKSETAISIENSIRNGIAWLDPFTKTEDFRLGVFSVSALFFLLSVGILFLYLTFRVLDKKRWSQA
ncbi:MAG: ABC transporter permease subunit [Clostridiales bacterium]|nr:ABC transporter permease subunit [Clostridiales bacterium]